MKTHYEVLGVHSQSETASIRAAYLSLIKRHHPDSNGGEAPAESDIYRINLAYSVLRDPVKRSSYDTELLRQRFVITPLPSRDRRVPAVIAKPFYRSRSQILALLILTSCLTAAVAGDTPVAVDVPLLSGPVAEARTILPSIVVPLAPLPGPEVELDPGIQDVVGIASFVSLEDALIASRRCFGDIRFGSPPSAGDRCIAFDLAFSYWNDGEFSGRTSERYFMPSVLQRRHRHALSFLSIDDAGHRMAAIRGRTFATVIEILSQRRREAAQQTQKAPEN